jgi:Tol biopolymer transport system component
MKVYPAILTSLVVALALFAASDPPAAWAQVSRVSVASNGTQANGASSSPAVSRDGRFVAFVSEASNLVSGDTNGLPDVFVRDRATSVTTRVSVASDGTQANGGSSLGALSASGRIVAFQSGATNLGGCDSGVAQVFVHDRDTGATTCVSTGPGGVQGNLVSSDATLSPDGRFVAFASRATNLVGGCGDPAFFDAFIHDRTTGTTTCVRLGGNTRPVAMSADGRFVLFNAGFDPRFSGIYLHDQLTGMNENLGGRPFFGSALSGDGRFVGLAGGQAYVRDRVTGVLRLVSVASDGTEGVGQSFSPLLSADARFVAFISGATNLVPGDTNGVFDVFLHDTFTGLTRRVSVAADGTQANGASDSELEASISADGRVVAFGSLASNLVPGDTNGVHDVFVAEAPVFPGGVFVASGHLDGPGAAAIVTGAGAGREPYVRTFTPDGFPRPTSFLAYPAGFSGGVRVAACDVDGDGRAEIITGAGPGGGPHVRVVKLDPAGYPVGDLASFLAYPAAFAGGVFVACGDIDGDSVPEIVVGPDAGGGPHVRVLKLDGSAPGGVVPFLDFLAYVPAFAGGVRVAAGNVDGTDRASLVLAPGPGGGPHVRVLKWTGSALTDLANFFAYSPAFTGGVFVAAGDLTGDGRAEIVTGTDAGGGPHVRAFTGTGADTGVSFFAYPAGFLGGVRVALGELDGAGPAEILTAAGPKGGPHIRAFTGAGSPAATSFLAY